jgi:hypothetical protein
MRDVMGSFYSFRNATDDELMEMSWEEVVAGEPVPVCNFIELTDAVAKLSFGNPQFNLVFRGQRCDHKTHRRKLGKVTSLLPSSYRSSDEASLDHLPAWEKELVNELAEMRKGRPKHSRTLVTDIGNFRETLWAILQHYGCATPLLDVTQSLQVASSFATHDYEKDAPSSEGYVYVLGMPSIYGMISFSGHEGIVIVKLQSVCPPEAKRPHYQEGYLVGSVPHTPDPSRFSYRDLALRLIGKFRIPDSDVFWRGLNYRKLPKDILMPREEEDEMTRRFQSVRNRVSS